VDSEPNQREIPEGKMKKTAMAMLALMLYTTAASGQTTAPPHSASPPGRLKIWAGAGLLASGLFVMPVTAVGNDHGRYSVPLLSVGLVAAGGSLIYWGVRDKQKARQPNTTIGVTFRRSAGIQVRRSW
jgi:hypothetical protein